MISQLKATNVALGYHKSVGLGPGGIHHKRGSTVGRELGETNKMYSYVQRRGYESNVLPLTANSKTMRPGNSSVPFDNKTSN